MEILKGFSFDIQLFATSITLNADASKTFWNLDGNDSVGATATDSANTSANGYISYDATASTFSVTSGTSTYGTALTVSMATGAPSAFVLSRSTEAGAKITNFTFTNVLSDASFSSVANGDVLTLAASATGVTADGITYKETAGAGAAVTFTDKDAPSLAAGITATLVAGKKVTANTEVVTAGTGTTIDVTGTGEVSNIGLGETVTIGDWTYTVKETYVLGTTSTKTNKYKWNGSDAITIQNDGTAAGVDTVKMAGVAVTPVTAGPIPVNEYNKELVLNRAVYYDEDGLCLGTTKTNEACVSVTKTSSGYTITSLAKVNNGTYVQLDKTVANTITGGSVGGLKYNLNTVTAGGATVTAASATFSVAAGATVKTTTAGAVDVQSGTISVADNTNTALSIAVGSSTVALGLNSGTGQTIAKGGVLTKFAATDTITADKGTAGEIAMTVNGVSATLVVTDSQAVDSVLTIQTISGTATPALTSGKARTSSKLNYSVTTNGLAEFSGSGDGVVVDVANGAGTFATVSDLEDGETVKLNDDTTNTAYHQWSVSGKKLEYKDYTTVAGTLSPEKTKYWTLTGTAVSTTNATTPTAGDVNEGITIGTNAAEEFKFNSDASKAGAAVATTIVDGVYVLKDGSTSLSKDKAVGQFSVKDDVVTYTGDSSASGQHIVVTDLASTLTWSVVGSGGSDSIEAGGTKATTIDGSAGNDTIKVSGTAADYIYGGAGNDIVTVSGGGDDSIDAGAGNDTVFGAGAGEKIMYGGDGNDLLVHADKKPNDTTPTAGTTASSLVGAAGDDTLIAGLLADTVIGGAGKDVFAGDFAGITISDYKVSEDVILYNAYGSASAKLNLAAANFNSDGTFSNAAGNTVDVSAGTGVTGYYAATLVDGAGKNKQLVGWTNADGGTLNVSTLKDNLFLVANNNDAADLIQSGSGKDTVYAGNYDSVVAGAGNDEIHLNGASAGAFVGINTSSGKDTVYSFNASFDSDLGDQVVLMEGAAKDVSLTLVDGDNDSNVDDVTVKLGTSQMFLKNVTTTAGGVAEVLVSGKKAAVAAANATIAAAANDYADFFFGNGSALSFSGTSDNVSVDLRDTTTYRKIATVEGGTGASTLIGSTGKDLLISAGGETSLWGGAGTDTMQGLNGNKDMFFFANGDGMDTIANFEAYTVDTADTADVLNTNGAAITSAKIVSAGLQIGLNDTDKVTITSITDENSVVQFTQDGKKLNYAKVGKASSSNTFTYEQFVNAYVGGNQKDTLMISGDTDAQVWLNGSKGVSYSGIKNIDAVSSTGTVILAGAGADETITGGAGASSLWGGAGNDTLNGTAGTTAYFYGYGEGNDVINVASSASAEDVVNLYNITLDKLSSGVIDSSKITINTTAGETLTVNTTKNIKFTLADGSSYTANLNTKGWE